MAVVVLVVVLVAAILDEVATSGVRSLPPPAAVVEPQPLGSGQFRFVPRSGRVSVGVPYRFSLYTGCGLDWPPAVDFDGSFWDRIVPGQASDGSDNPPVGYAKPFDQGIMTLISPTLAQYRSLAGVVTQWSRHAGARIASPCS